MLLLFFRRWRRRDSLPRFRTSLFTSKMWPASSKHWTSRAELEPEMRDSLIDAAAPVASRSRAEHATARQSRRALPALITLGATLAKFGAVMRNSLGGILRRPQSSQTDRERSTHISSASTTSFGDDTSANSEHTAEAIISPPPIHQLLDLRPTDLAQQAYPAPSANCPIHRLQTKLRLHNSTDPRPKCAVIRDSVSSVESGTSSCSSRTSSRFSFGLLLQPSLDFFKFRDVRTSGGGRGSGWSLWFKQDGRTKEKSAPEKS